MIRGIVNARREAVVPLCLRGPDGAELDVDAIIDSGFMASLTLPNAVVAALRLPRQSVGGAVLADGSLRQFDVFAAEVAWDGGWRPVLVSAVGDEVLLGMRLLADHELRIAVDAGIGPRRVTVCSLRSAQIPWIILADGRTSPQLGAARP